MRESQFRSDVDHNGVNVEAGPEHESVLRFQAEVRTTGSESAKGDAHFAVGFQDWCRRQPHLANDRKLPGAAAVWCRRRTVQRYVVIQRVGFESDEGKTELHHWPDDEA